jgi:hypothetical protein
MAIAIKKTSNLANVFFFNNTFDVDTMNMTSWSNSSHYLFSINMLPGCVIEAAYAWSYTVIIKLNLTSARSSANDTYNVIAGINSTITQTVIGNYI